MSTDGGKGRTDTSLNGGGATDIPRYDWAGRDAHQRGQGSTDAGRVPAPDLIPYGLTALEFHDYQQKFTKFAASRILGVGKSQYDHGSAQAFEDMTPYDLGTGLREELADVVNYAVMIDIQLTRIAQRWHTYKEATGIHE